MMGQMGILFCMPKIKEPMVKRPTFLFFHWNRKSKIDDPVIISPLVFTPRTKMPSDSPCATILILPHPTLFTIILQSLLPGCDGIKDWSIPVTREKKCRRSFVVVFLGLWSGIFLLPGFKRIRPCLQRDRVTSVGGSDFGQDRSVIKYLLF